MPSVPKMTRPPREIVEIDAHAASASSERRKRRVVADGGAGYIAITERNGLDERAADRRLPAIASCEDFADFSVGLKSA